MLDRLLALLQLVGLAFLELLELRLGKLQEGLVVRRERVCASAFSVEPSDARASSSVLTRLAYWARTTSQVAASTDEQTDDESDDHWGRENPRDRVGRHRHGPRKRRPRRTRKSIGTGSQSLCAQGRRGQAGKARSLRTFGRRRGANSRLRRSIACWVCCRVGLGPPPDAWSLPSVGPTKMVGVPVTFFCVRERVDGLRGRLRARSC